MPNSIAISVNKLTVGYPRSKTWLSRMFLKPNAKGLRDVSNIILSDLNFEIPKGQVCGVIGKNGCGKTTLLRVMAGVLPPISGDVLFSSSRISPMLAVGVGFNEEFSGIENIKLNANILKLEKQQINEKIDKIIEFADIGDAINAAVKTYSSGMKARLGFGIYATLDSDIILIDETLSVGDKSFQKKSLNLIFDLKAKNTTIVIVSHSLNLIETLCDRVIWINEKKIEHDGYPEDVINRYASSFSTDDDITKFEDLTYREGSLDLIVTGLGFYDYKLQKIENLTTGIKTVLKFSIDIQGLREDTFEDLDLAFAVFTSTGEKLVRYSSLQSGFEIEKRDKAFEVFINFEKFQLTSGSYYLGYRLVNSSCIVDYVRKALSFEVGFGDYFGTGIMDNHSPIVLDSEWSQK